MFDLCHIMQLLMINAYIKLHIENLAYANINKLIAKVIYSITSLFKFIQTGLIRDINESQRNIIFNPMIYFMYTLLLLFYQKKMEFNKFDFI